MKKIFLFACFALLAFGDMFQSVQNSEATLLQSGNSKEYCPNCAMHLPKYYKTNHAVKLKDGSVRQFCSLHCLVDEQEMGFLRDKKDKIIQILVADVKSLKFIDAKKAFYIVGSKVPGTMTGNSQYAFLDKNDALAFQKENGGKLVGFDEAYKISLKDFTNDLKMIKDKKDGSVYNAGKTIMQKFCDESKIASIHAHNIGETKAAIKNSDACKELSDSQLQALSIYYWDLKLGNFEKSYGSLLK